MKEVDGTAATRESADCSRGERAKNGGHFGTKAEEGPQAKGTEDMKGEVPTAKAVPDFCLVFAESVLKLVNRRATVEVENIIRLFTDGDIDAGQICQHVKEIND